ncbi:MAG TPA: PqiC family protein [Steroidobacteraceae bacterium]|nr:PqiC family protein [Steroidobacteraceae bacterium]
MTISSKRAEQALAQVSAGRARLELHALRTGHGTRRLTVTMATAVLSALVLVGCASSPPLQFYTLSEVAPTSNTGATTQPLLIRVGRVRIPGELDRNELMQRINATRLRIAEQERWAGPLGDMIRRVLSADLQARGAMPFPTANESPGSAGAQGAADETTAGAMANAAPEPRGTSANAAAAPRSTSGGVNTLAVNIDELMGDASCVVTLRAAWELRSGTGDAPVVRSGYETIRTPPSAGTCSVSALPMAMSQALAELSDRVIAAAR